MESNKRFEFLESMVTAVDAHLRYFERGYQASAGGDGRAGTPRWSEATASVLDQDGLPASFVPDVCADPAIVLHPAPAAVLWPGALPAARPAGAWRTGA